MSVVDAVDGSSTGTSVPWMWALLYLGLAQTGLTRAARRCPLLGVDRKSRFQAVRSPSDPLRKSATSEDISSDGTFTVFQLFSLPC
jgi:hypothetical protein